MTTAASEATTAASVWKLDPPHSTVSFSVPYVVGRYRAGFASFDATLDLTGEQPRIEGTADPRSITIALEPFRDHMLGEEFFDAERHPEIRFVTTRFDRAGDAVEVEGDLTLRGVTRSVSAIGTLTGPTETLYTGPAMGLRLDAAIKRSDFGFGWNPELPGGGLALADRVTLEIDLQFLLGN